MLFGDLSDASRTTPTTKDTTYWAKMGVKLLLDPCLPLGQEITGVLNTFCVFVLGHPKTQKVFKVGRKIVTLGVTKTREESSPSKPRRIKLRWPIARRCGCLVAPRLMVVS